jgi:hypothetical protein
MIQLSYEYLEYTIQDFLLTISPICNVNPIGQRKNTETSPIGKAKPSKFQAIINEILMGFDICEIKLVEKINGSWKLESVDGGHRKRAIIAFINNEFPLHKSSLYGEIYYKDFTEEQRKHFLCYKLRIVTYKNLSNNDIGRLFRTTNTVTSVNFMEMLNSFGDTPIANLVREFTTVVTEKNNVPHTLFEYKKKGQTTKYIYLNFDNLRLKLDEIVARILYLIYSGEKLNSYSNENLYNMYSDNKITQQDCDSYQKKVNTVLNYLLNCSKVKRANNNGVGLTSNELTLLMRLYFHLKGTHGEFSVIDYNKFYMNFREIYLTYISKNPSQLDIVNDDKGSRTKAEAMKGYLGEINNFKKIKQTVNWLLEDLDILSLITIKDSNRKFDRELVEQALIIQNYKCYIDGKHLSLTDADGAHIIAWSEGGRTNAENLRAVRKEHNRAMGTMNLETYKSLLKKVA